MWLRSSTRWLTACTKNVTREYKAKLTKDQRKAFRSQMWAFRRDPESLSAEEKQALEALFEKMHGAVAAVQGSSPVQGDL